MANRFWTSFFDSISDKRTRYYFNQEVQSRLVSEHFFNKFRGKSEFKAIVLQLGSGNPQNASTRSTNPRISVAIVRPMEVDDNILPEPCVDPPHGCQIDKETYQRYIIDLHPVAYSDAVEGSTATSLSVGDTVMCYYADQGPDNQGQLRGLRYRPIKLARLSTHFNFDCLEGLAASASNFAATPGNGQGRLVQTPNVQCQDKNQRPKGATARDIYDAYNKNTGFGGRTVGFQRRSQMDTQLAQAIVETSERLGIPDPGWLANLIRHETANMFDPTMPALGNPPPSSANGLIQFLDGVKVGLLRRVEKYTGKSGKANNRFTAADVLSTAELIRDGQTGTYSNSHWTDPDSSTQKAAAKAIFIDTSSGGFAETPAAQMPLVELYFSKYKAKADRNGGYENPRNVMAAVFYPDHMGKPDSTPLGSRAQASNPNHRTIGDYYGKVNRKAWLPTDYCEPGQATSPSPGTNNPGTGAQPTAPVVPTTPTGGGGYQGPTGPTAPTVPTGGTGGGGNP